MSSGPYKLKLVHQGNSNSTYGNTIVYKHHPPPPFTFNRLEFKEDSIFLFSLDLTESSRRPPRGRDVKFLRSKCYFRRKKIVGQTSTDPFQGTRFVFTLANSILIR